jgi:hypothetical protein
MMQAFSFFFNSIESLIAEYFAPTGRAPDEKNRTKHPNLKIRAICVDEFPPLDQHGLQGE